LFITKCRWNHGFTMLMVRTYEIHHDTEGVKRMKRNRSKRVAISGQRVEAIKAAAILASPPRTPVRSAVEKVARSGVKSVREYLLLFVKSHPLGAIAFTSTSENFRRGDKILTQANVFVLMLSFSVAFYYSKSTECVKQLTGYLGCPAIPGSAAMGSSFVECMG
jgi:hypothetical protein